MNVMSECLFCRIAAKKIPANILWENDQVLAFEDINPQAPVHFLIIPKKHYDSLLEIPSEDYGIISEIWSAAKKLVVDKKIDQQGFRWVVNTRDHGGQAVKHLHVHILGGRSMHWPPG